MSESGLALLSNGLQGAESSNVSTTPTRGVIPTGTVNLREEKKKEKKRKEKRERKEKKKEREREEEKQEIRYTISTAMRCRACSLRYLPVV